MKKPVSIIVSLLLASATLFGLVGCDSNSQDEIANIDEYLHVKTDVISVGDLPGTLYTASQAYGNGYLTKTELQDSCYYRFGFVAVYENNDTSILKKIDYTPKTALAELDKKVEEDIKETYFRLNPNKFYSDGQLLGGVETLTVNFYGEYNDLQVVTIESSLWKNEIADGFNYLGGVAWWKADSDFYVYRGKDVKFHDGTFYSMSDALRLGLLTKRDFEYCCYYRSGEAQIGSSVVGPYRVKAQVPLDERIEMKIKRIYFRQNYEDLKGKYRDMSIEDLTMDYYGDYGSSYVFIMKDLYYVESPDDATCYDYYWHLYGIDDYLVFRFE